MYYHRSDFAAVNKLFKTGYTQPLVRARRDTKAAEIEKEVLQAGGYKIVNMVFMNPTIFSESVENSKQKLIQSILG